MVMDMVMDMAMAKIIGRNNMKGKVLFSLGMAAALLVGCGKLLLHKRRQLRIHARATHIRRIRHHHIILL